MFKHTQFHYAKGAQRDDLANDKASTLAVLADVEQWGSNYYYNTMTISEQDRPKRVTPPSKGSGAYYAMEHTAG